VSKKSGPPLIFNLFPRFFNTIDEWSTVLDHVNEMGFNAVFVNPFHETGFSGSLYAVKDYYKLNPLFLKEGQDPTDFGPLSKFLEQCKKYNLHVIMDLVINHTAIDSGLTKSHPKWYKYDENGKLHSPYAIDPANPANVTVWGDLATIDNEESEERESLWDYWDGLIAYFQKMGISGYRCDAAYQVPAPLWKKLISTAKKRNEKTLFYAETLGCQLSEIEALKDVGFDYLFNSSKWWDFDEPWALEQHESNRTIAPSIAFPESHDTERLASVAPGTIEVQKMRYAFAASFSEGLMVPMGYEYGATTRINVVKGRPEDVDEPQWDISTWIKDINKLKLRYPVLSEEGSWKVLSGYHLPYIFLEKVSNHGKPSVIFCINKDHSNSTQVEEWALPTELVGRSKAFGLLSEPITEMPIPPGFIMDPSEIIMFV